MYDNKIDFMKVMKYFLFVLVTSIFLCTGFVAPAQSADADATQGFKPVKGVPNPGAELWREVRQRGGPIEGRTQVAGVDAGTLINTQGQAWRELRTEKLIPYSGYLLGSILLAIIAFRLIRGAIKVEAGPSGKRIMRFTLSQRTIHWVVAILFVILGITGVVLLLGRTLLIPVIGNSAFASIAAFSKLLHDYCGPIFAVALVFMFFSYLKGNFYKLKDISWFLKAGGMLSKGTHASAGRYNAGEKTWFWLAMLGGAVVVATGLILDFPIFEQARETMKQASMLHTISAVIVLAASFGHIYLGTIGMEGALDTMMTGYCDENWAKEHHDEWYEEVKDTAEAVPTETTSASPPGTSGATNANA